MDGAIQCVSADREYCASYHDAQGCMQVRYDTRRKATYLLTIQWLGTMIKKAGVEWMDGREVR